MDNIIFIGMPASGKSTVGNAVAKRLGYAFVDMDTVIKEQEGKNLSEIIGEVGNDGFLKIENQVNKSIQVEKSVISPGGSVVYCKEAMEHFKEIGTIVYLHVSFRDIRKRIKSLEKRGVVLREGQSFRELYNERCALCKRYADVIVDETGFRKEDTVNNVIKTLRKYRKKQRRKREREATA
jgi:shikimate kinase